MARVKEQATHLPRFYKLSLDGPKPSVLQTAQAHRYQPLLVPCANALMPTQFGASHPTYIPRAALTRNWALPGTRQRTLAREVGEGSCELLCARGWRAGVRAAGDSDSAVSGNAMRA